MRITRVITISAVPQARRAGTSAANGIKQSIQSGRGWVAPRMHQAADAFTVAVAPMVTSALHNAASRLEPEPAPRGGIRRLLDWRLLLGIGATLAAASAAAAMTVRKRYQVATMAAVEDAEIAESGDKEMPATGQARQKYDASGRVKSGKH